MDAGFLSGLPPGGSSRRRIEMIGALAAVSLVVGALIGAVGIGGILLIPGLVLLGRLPIHAASATALFTFLFTGALSVGALT